MATRNNSGKLAELSDDSFKDNLNELIPLIEAEWPSMDTEVIKAAEGDFDAVVDYIADQTEHTRTLVRRQLAELNSLAIRDRAAKEAQVKPAPSGSSTHSTSNDANGSGLSSEIDQILQVLERHTEDLVGQFKKDVLPEVSDRARSNIGTSLLTALGIGFLLGIIIGGGRGR
ncbi:MAG: hypothetical protein ACTS2F_20970 [Thainema sp.]